MKFQPPVKPVVDPLNRQFHLPRLTREFYQGDAVVLWTLTVFDRAKGWLTPAFQERFQQLMLHAAAREGLVCPIYCLMPNHLHLVWMGLRPDTDQLNGMTFLRTHLEPELAPAIFQPQPHDEVLREDQRKRNALARACFYLAANPIRANLTTQPEDWKYTGCVLPGYPNLNPLEKDYWPKFWRIHGKLRHPKAGHLVRPPMQSGGVAKPRPPL
jgi:putative transposase